MNFELNSLQLDYQDRARQFAREELLPGVIDRDIEERFPMELLKKLGDADLIGIQFDKKYGGKGDDFLSFILVVEELCKVDAAFGIAYAISSTFTTGIDLFANEEQKLHCMPRAVCRRCTGLLCTDRAGCRFGCRFCQDDSNQGRRSLCDQRDETLYHKQRDCGLLYADCKH